MEKTKSALITSANPEIMAEISGLTRGARTFRNGRSPETSPGYCLKFVRQAVEAALKLGDTGFYRVITERADPKHSGFWARDAQKSMRALGWSVSPDLENGQLEPGDIVCNFRVSKPYGHIGIYVGEVAISSTSTLKVPCVIENQDARRGKRVLGAISITPLTTFDPDEAFRVPRDLKERKGWY